MLTPCSPSSGLSQAGEQLPRPLTPLADEHVVAPPVVQQPVRSALVVMPACTQEITLVTLELNSKHLCHHQVAPTPLRAASPPAASEELSAARGPPEVSDAKVGPCMSEVSPALPLASVLWLSSFVDISFLPLLLTPSELLCACCFPAEDQEIAELKRSNSALRSFCEDLSMALMVCGPDRCLIKTIMCGDADENHEPYSTASDAHCRPLRTQGCQGIVQNQQFLLEKKAERMATLRTELQVCE
jgi:hypothetical protein